MQMRLLPINILPRIALVRTNKRACCANQETTKRDYYSEEFTIHERTRESSVSLNGSSKKSDYHRMPIVAAVVAHRRLFPQTGSSAAGSKRSSCAVKLSALSILTPPLGAVGLKGACKKASAAFSSGGVVGNFTGGGATCRPLIDLKHIGALIKGPKGDVLQECRRYYAKGRDKPKSNKSKVVINENEIGEVIDVDKFRKQLEKLVDEMKDDFTKQLSIRGAAGALESLQVEFDGETYPLQELAQVGRKNPQLAILNLVSLPDAIQPVLKAIQESGMNLSPQQEGTTIYVPLPKYALSNEGAPRKPVKEREGLVHKIQNGDASSPEQICEAVQVSEGALRRPDLQRPATTVTTIAIGIGYHEYGGGSFGIFGQTCHRRFHNPFKYMATKSPYLDEGLDNEAALGDPFKPYHGGLCVPTMTWHLVRHGTRNSGAKVLRTMKNSLPRIREEILEAHSQGKGSLCNGELSEIRAWRAEPLPLEGNEKILVPQGEKELSGISRRFKLRFPDIFASNYHNDTFKFKYTKTQRAEASAKHFNKGIFHDAELEQIYYPTALHADPVLRFYKDCKKWKKEVDKNPEAYQERMKFETSSIFKQMITKIQTRLGLEKPPTLEESEIMYLACSFESAWDPSNPSPWCNVFDEHDFQLMEYRQDVEYYWIDGYGDKVSDPSAPSVTAYFTHSGTLLKVMARLGLFNDSVPLRGDNYDHHRGSRKWRTSLIDPFATNLAFVLYKCPENHKVGLLFKEKPIGQPLCDGKYLCPLEEFYAKMEPFTKNCDLDKLCTL
ncbi:Multiple inositol polyphosphate phosphatase 1 [Orchesella cincta]|uniref:Ribosome-recycling factor, mitochondrial n=1 Tax=Orchesella cincta TaxID=48709 RepID=A0A1D2NGJ7_ORCCI|nr:Multiple inositol polyphosphate phosphatase 1 [Orchesella cincta]